MFASLMTLEDKERLCRQAYLRAVAKRRGIKRAWERWHKVRAILDRRMLGE